MFFHFSLLFNTLIHPVCLAVRCVAAIVQEFTFFLARWAGSGGASASNVYPQLWHFQLGIEPSPPFKRVVILSTIRASCSTLLPVTVVALISKTASGVCPGQKELSIGFAIGNEFDPLDEMFFFHGMRHTADLYLDPPSTFSITGTCFSLAASTVFSLSSTPLVARNTPIHLRHRARLRRCSRKAHICKLANSQPFFPLSYAVDNEKSAIALAAAYPLIRHPPTLSDMRLFFLFGKLP